MGIQSQEISERQAEPRRDRRTSAPTFGPERRHSILTAEPERCLRRMPGRETFVWPGLDQPAPEGRLIVKRFERRGSLMRRRSPAQREYELLSELYATGLPVPQPYFWAQEGRRSVLAMELVEHGETLRMRLERLAQEAVQDTGEDSVEPAPAQLEVRWLVDELAHIVAQLHGRGWYHKDLYLDHVLVRRGTLDPGRLVLIDLGRARREPAPRLRWFIKDLAALLHSTPASIGPRLRLAFLARYLSLRGVLPGHGGRADRRRWVRRIERKQARMAAHRPRAGEHVPEHLAAERELRS